MAPPARTSPPLNDEPGPLAEPYEPEVPPTPEAPSPATSTQKASWESIAFKSGGTYEGLVKEGMPQGSGVIVYPDGDRYAGEFANGEMHGMGVYQFKKTGAVYFGEWDIGDQHGCGYMKHANGKIQEGEWVESVFVGDMGACSVASARTAAALARYAAREAGMFEHKPNGLAFLAKSYDLNQDPLVYGPGGGWRAPGPLGDTYLEPPEAAAAAAAEAAEIHARRFAKYNVSVGTLEEIAAWAATQAEKDKAAGEAIAAAAAAKKRFEEEEEDVEEEEEEDKTKAAPKTTAPGVGGAKTKAPEDKKTPAGPAKAASITMGMLRAQGGVTAAMGRAADRLREGVRCLRLHVLQGGARLGPARVGATVGGAAHLSGLVGFAMPLAAVVPR